METLSYKGKEYPYRTITIIDSGVERETRIADYQLYNSIMEGFTEPNYVEAQNIDDTIFFYVSSDELALPEKELTNLVKSHSGL